MSENQQDRVESFERYRRDWDVNARVDPMWAVLSLPEKMGGAWQEEEFYRIGEQEITEVFRFMNSNSIGLGSTDKVLDFGSGLGRLTEALARRFTTAVGIDISKSMIERATAHALSMKASNINYLLSTSTDLCDLGVGTFDFVYTNITLQHLDNDLQKTYIRQFAQLLRSNGIAAFQIPSGQRVERKFAFVRNLKFRNLIALITRSFSSGIPPWRINMEFNFMPENIVIGLAQQAGLRLEKIGYIGWEEFYQNHSFRLHEEVPDEASSYPISPVYFFRAGS